MVFNALMMRALVISDSRLYPDELAAFRACFRTRRFRILLTSNIISEYQKESNKQPQFLPLPVLNGLSERSRAVQLDESQLAGVSGDLAEFPREHRAFIRDAIKAGAEYLVTRRRRWLALAGPTETNYGLRIVTPGRFVELEG